MSQGKKVMKSIYNMLTTHIESVYRYKVCTCCYVTILAYTSHTCTVN